MNDSEIRKAVLQVMNKARKEARHEYEIRMHLSQIEKALSDDGVELEDEQIMQAVNYLYEAKMLKQEKETKTIKLPKSKYASSWSSGGSNSVKHTNFWYSLTIKAIDELEGETEYSKKAFIPYQNIHITTSNAPVIVGSNNQVSNNVVIFNQLNELQQAFSESNKLSVDERRDIVGDIESLKQQLAKPNPSSIIIKALWANISKVADIAGVAGLVFEIAKAIAPILGMPIS